MAFVLQTVCFDFCVSSTVGLSASIAAVAMMDDAVEREQLTYLEKK